LASEVLAKEMASSSGTDRNEKRNMANIPMRRNANPALPTISLALDPSSMSRNDRKLPDSIPVALVEIDIMIAPRTDETIPPILAIKVPGPITSSMPCAVIKVSKHLSTSQLVPPSKMRSKDASHSSRPPFSCQGRYQP